MGIVINRPVDLSLKDILSQMNIEPVEPQTLAMPVYLGGPVQNNRGFILHEPLGKWESTLAITDTLGVTTSRDILVAIANNQGPTRALLVLGYAGWGAGQLEREIVDNAWLSGPATADILFSTPAEARWRAAANLLGVDLTKLSAEAGHA